MRKRETRGVVLDRDLDAELVRYEARPPVATKLDAYKGIIAARLEGFPRLTAQRLFEEIEEPMSAERKPDILKESGGASRFVARLPSR